MQRVFIILETAPGLTQLTAFQLELVGKPVTDHHDVGSLGKIIFPPGFVRLVQPVTQTVVKPVGQVTFDFQTEQPVGKGRTPPVVSIRLRLHAGSIVDVDIEHIVVFFQAGNLFGQRLELSVVGSITMVVLCLCTQRESKQTGT